MATKNITVIGGGIGGYTAAIRAARLGAAVTLIEKADLGGTCLNWGCIPAKSLLHSAEIMRTISEAKTFGIKVGKPSVDLPEVMKRKDTVVAGLRKGVAGLLAAKKIKVINAQAEVVDPKTVKAGKETIKGDALIIATGSAPATLPIPGLDKAGAWDSNDFLSMTSLPKSAVIIGGGVIGIEFAQILSGLGCKVAVLEMMDQIIPGLDTEIAGALQAALAKQGIDIVTSAKVDKVAGAKAKSTVHYTTGGKAHQKSAERIIMAVGRKPMTDGLNADKLGLAMDGGALVVNDRMLTSLDGVYAIGDCTGRIMLAHVAAAQAEVAAECAIGHDRAMSYKAVPACIYTTPEVASVGLSEEAAKQEHEVEVGRFPFVGVGKAAVLNQAEGLVKIVADKKYGEVLGVHMIGPRATDMIAEAVLGIGLETTAEEMAHAIHPHPTLSEAVMEAALGLCGGPIHMP